MRPPPRSRQERLLAPAAALLRDVAAEQADDPAAARGALCDVLDAAAARVGGFDLEGYRAVLSAEPGSPFEPRLDAAPADGWAAKLLDLVDAGGVPRRLALACLAQPGATERRRRTTGAYYTDFRLARSLARRTALLGPLDPASTVLDTAAGTGVLLVALAEEVCGPDGGALRELVGHGLSAVDVDPRCRRGTLAALASLTAELPALARLAARVHTADSLVAPESLWGALTAGGRFDAVIGNPPWERLRVTRHEVLRAAGALRHYGADYEGTDCGSAAGPVGGVESGRIRDYLAELAARYPVLGDRQVDLSHAFLALNSRLLRPGGSLGMLVPAGVIRSQGTAALRAQLFAAATDVDLTVLHNHSRFFGIDTRFKFLVVCARLGAAPTADGVPTGNGMLTLRHGTPGGAAVRIPVAELAAARGDLTVPEVSSERQWQIFRHLSSRGVRPDAAESPWAVRIVREVDMTQQRPLFRRHREGAALPVVEGRMVAQYRSGAKSYVGGTGRAATWRPVPLGGPDAAAAQFFVDPVGLPGVAAARVDRARVGFCDIVGQTNERTLQAALIRPGRVCGNKVPTLDFLAAGGDPHDREMLFLAVANSIVVDWFVRRVVTTSLNYFILRGLPLPPLDPGDPVGRRLVDLAECLVAAERVGTEPELVAAWRAEIDVAMCTAYRLDPADLPVLLADFPLLDRRQPALPGETRSTVTSDLLLATCGDATARERWLAARAAGAVAYVPEEFATLTRSR